VETGDSTEKPCDFWKTADFHVLKVNREEKSARKRRSICDSDSLSPESLAVKPKISEVRI
jgi:hypothetical protein